MKWSPRHRTALLAGAAILFLSLLFLPACCCVGRRRSDGGVRPEPSPPIGLAHFDVPREAVPATATQAEMKNVDFRVDRTIVLRIHDLRGEMQAKDRGQPLNFDDKRSFVLRMFEARIGLDGRSLSDLMNHYVFAYDGAPLRDLQITVEGGKLRQEGIMHKIIDIPFIMFADVSATPEGHIRIHPTKIEICNLDGQQLLKAFGLNLEELLDLSKAKGLRVETNDLIIDPLRVLPPPDIEGTLVDVVLAGEEMVQVFDSGVAAPALATPRPNEPNYMYYAGGTLRMGKLFMVRADMQVIDADPRDELDFFLDYYNNQLAAGYNRVTERYGLEVFMRDFDDLAKPAPPGERLAPTSATSAR
ncbi:MAG TPA: hypothetical protein VIL97_06145 [Thermoanaerobaculia bacterium]